MSRYCCRAFGLRLESDIPLPAPSLRTTARPDATIRLLSAPARKRAGGLRVGKLTSYGTPHPFLFPNPIRVDSLYGSFLAHNGDTLQIRPPHRCSPWIWALPQLGLPLLLYQRDLPVLHAAALKIGRTGVLLLGSSGAGKSTLALALAAHGAALFSDDLTPLHERNGTPHAARSFPTTALSDDSRKALPLPFAKRLEPMAEFHDKPRFRIPKLPKSDSAAISHVYVLRHGERDGIRNVDDRKAATALILRHLVMFRLLSRLAPGFAFRHASRLATTVAVRVFTRRWDLKRLSGQVRRIEDDVS